MKRISNQYVPHPFPYQGSKRGIAKDIIPYFPSDLHRLIEPFCGAAAISIAAAVHGLAKEVVLNDINEPLMNLWKEILERPMELADDYEKLWLEQHTDPKKFFFRIRNDFNISHQPHQLLYLLARIVKGAVRYSSDGLFNQSADNRRLGMRPNTMRKNLVGVSRVLSPITTVSSVDFRGVVINAKHQDLIYMDPPYQGTSFTRDHRYFGGIAYEDFVDVLTEMNKNNLSYIISYDGITGEKAHGRRLPECLSLEHIYLHAGRSTQATLLGTAEETIESLYLSPALVERLGHEAIRFQPSKQEHQLELAFA